MLSHDSSSISKVLHSEEETNFSLRNVLRCVCTQKINFWNREWQGGENSLCSLKLAHAVAISAGIHNRHTQMHTAERKPFSILVPPSDFQLKMREGQKKGRSKDRNLRLTLHLQFAIRGLSLCDSKTIVAYCQ